MPPRSPITEPRIYFGLGVAWLRDRQNRHAGVQDYPKGKDNVYARYDGADGIPIGGIVFGEPLFALANGRPQHPAQRLHHQREQDPASSQHQGSRGDDRAIPSARSRPLHVVISAGRLYWMGDAYTTSAWFPYAKPEPDPGDLNYIRNSVKVVIDAYNGTVNFLRKRTPPIRLCGYRRDLPLAVQAVRCDAAGSAKAHSLPGGPFHHSGSTVPRVSHGRARGLLQSRR